MTIQNDTPPAIDDDGRRGFVMAMSVYVLWGFMPIYMKALGHIPPLEFLAHRVVWAVPVAGIMLVYRRRMADVVDALRTPRTLAMIALAAVLISINTGTYLWAVNTGRALEGALAYFINPLFSVVLGAVFLKEKLSPTQIGAVCLATLAVIILTVDAGQVPLVALTMAVSWGLYGFIRKVVPVGPNQGLFLEVLLLCFAGLPYLIYLEATGEGHFLHGEISVSLLLISAGFVTAIPLMIFAAGAKLLRLSTLGIMQYVTPTIVFLIAVFAFHEPLSMIKLVAFAMIWAALALYTASMLMQLRGR